MKDDALRLSRRRLFAAAAAAGALALTPSRADADESATPPSIEGPYFKPRSPERASLREADTKGDPFTLTGRVLTTKGAPVEKALLDVWQADGDGAYDLKGFRLRGHQFTATGKDAGDFRVDTVVPGYYPGRTRHIHVKVQAPGRDVLTTQPFFPNDPRNRDDSLYSTWLRMRVEDGGKGVGLVGQFTFVIEA